MGYRSNVSLVMKRDLFNKIMEETRETSTRLIECVDDILVHEDSILLLWNHVKWYSDDRGTDVGKFCMSLQNNAETEDHFYMVVMGEDIGDNQYIGQYWDNPWETGIQRKLYWDSSVGNRLEAFK